jgi:tRNA A-37 threonylcarbamoyl transferase component Bud32
MQKIGRYQIEEEIGRGAMGVVYVAHDPRVRRRVAVKTYHLPEGLSPDEEREFHERFLREAQAAGALTHPAIVTLYDADEDPDQGIPFIAMEYVPGRSLKELLESQGRMSPEEVFEMAATLAGALHEAHQAGVIHRDIKPANILVRDSDKAVKITDFGVARISTSDLTRTGHTLGSPAYMSPEQMRGEVVGGQSDLFSLAVVLYEALCGEKPFTGPDLPALAYSVAHETPVPISRRVKGLPAGVDTFFDRALAKDPAARFPSGVAFRQALQAVRDGKRTAVRAAGPPASPDATLVEATAPEQPALGAATSRSFGLGLIRSLRERWPALRANRFRRWSFAVAALTIVGIAGSWGLWQAGRQSTLILEGRNKFEDATLTLLVDGEEVYSRYLTAERKSARMFGRKMFEYGQEKFEARISVSAGRREVVARVEPKGESTAYTDKTVVVLEAGEARRLKLISGVSRSSPVSLEPD